MHASPCRSRVPGLNLTFLLLWAALAPAYCDAACGAFQFSQSSANGGRKTTQRIIYSALSDVQLTPTFDYGTISPISDSGCSDDTLAIRDFPSDEELGLLPKGRKAGFRVIRHYEVPLCGFNVTNITLPVNQQLGLTKDNVTLQVALTLLDPGAYPSLTRARKACRKGSILIHRGPTEGTDITDAFCSARCHRGRVGDRVFPGDVIGCQVMMGTFKKKRCYPNIDYSRPRFALPVAYEDDHLAIVNKPAGIGVYGHRRSRSGSLSRRTIRDALPFCLTPPSKGTVGGVLRRPVAVHRLDTPTSGLLVVAKTKAAMTSLYMQFAERKVTKTYTAIVNGVPNNGVPSESHALMTDTREPSDVDLAASSVSTNNGWNTVDYPLGGKYAITEWRALRSAKSLNAKDGILTLVQVKPRTGRYHQIRRHMAWLCRRPLVGDALYAGALQLRRFRRNGLYLCSNGITLEHPFYNTKEGRKVWDEIMEISAHQKDDSLRLSEDGSTVEVSVTLDLPKRFFKLLDGEEAWAKRALKEAAKKDRKG